MSYFRRLETWADMLAKWSQQPGLKQNIERNFSEIIYSFLFKTLQQIA